MVAPSSPLRLQLLTGPVGDLVPPSVVLDEFESPVSAGLSVRSLVGAAGGLDVEEVRLVLGPLLLLKSLPLYAPLVGPVLSGLMLPPLLPSNVVGNRDGLALLAARLNAPRH